MAKIPVPLRMIALFVIISFATMFMDGLFLVNLNTKPSMAMMHHDSGTLIVGAADDHEEDNGHAQEETVVEKDHHDEDEGMVERGDDMEEGDPNKMDMGGDIFEVLEGMSGEDHHDEPAESHGH